MAYNYSSRGANIYDLVVAFTMFEPLLQWYAKHLKTTLFFLLAALEQHWDQMWIKFAWRKSKFAEGKRTQNTKDTHLLLVAVTFALCTLFLGEYCPVDSWTLILWAKRSEESVTAVSLHSKKMEEMLISSGHNGHLPDQFLNNHTFSFSLKWWLVTMTTCSCLVREIPWGKSIWQWLKLPPSLIQCWSG